MCCQFYQDTNQVTISVKYRFPSWIQNLRSDKEFFTQNLNLLIVFLSMTFLTAVEQMLQVGYFS